MRSINFLLTYLLTYKTQNPLKLPGVPQTNETISGASGPKSPYCEDMWGKYCCLTIFPIVDTCLRGEDIARDKVVGWCPDGILSDFLRPVFLASRVHHVSDLHLKFALEPHHVWKYGRHLNCDG